MTAKEYLSGARSITIRLKAMAEQLEFLKAAAEYIAPQFSHMPKAPRNIHKHEDAMIRVLEFEERMNAQYAELAGINEALELISDPQKQAILVKRYISGKTWEAIAAELYISVRHSQRLHGDALEELEQLLNVGTECR